ncbi:MAG: SPASM domain-containing protein [Pseudomonadota bacterium]|nr:SPASM domain-containing protein [Pseudomonadota bacterium]
MATSPSHLGVLQIEPTDHCNLACAMCAPHAERWETVHGVPKGFLDPSLFQHVLDGLVAEDCRFDHVILQWLGDPSLHPALEEFVATAGRTLRGRVGYLRFDTNALTFGPERVARLVARRDPEVPLLVVFTLDAATADTYTRVKGRDGLARARRHVRALLSARARMPPPHNLHVQVQFVVQPGNAHEAGEFLRYWTDALTCHGAGHGHAEILFKRLSVGGGAAGQAEADRLYERTMTRFGIVPVEGDALSVRVWSERPWQRDDAHAARTACPGLWFTPVVRQDGHLLMCCADLRGELDLGSLADTSFRTLWDGEKATRTRLAHLAGRFEGACAGCGGINWYTLGPEHAAAARARGVALGIEA